MGHQTDESPDLAAPLVAFLTLATLGIVFWLFSRHNYWASVFVVWVCVQAGFMWWQWANGKARVLLPWFIVSVAVLLAFTTFAPIPVTTISMGVAKRSISAAVTLNDLERKNVQRGTSDPRALGWLDTDWLSRHSFGHSTLTLGFGAALDDRMRGLEIRFGKHPARFDLTEIAIGSDILGFRYPLTIWTGKQILDSDLFRPRHSKLTMRDYGHVELLGPKTRPTIGLSINRAQAFSNRSASRESTYRLIWIVVFLIAPCLFLAAGRSARKLDQIRRSVGPWLSG